MVWGIGVRNIPYQILISTSVPYIQANLLSPLDYSDYISKSLDHPGIVATVCKEICLADEINECGLYNTSGSYLKTSYLFILPFST